MTKFNRFAILFLALGLCAFSLQVARKLGVNAYYVSACAFALIGIGAFGFPALGELSVARPARLRTWWGPAVLSFGLLLLVGVLAARFVLVPAA
jgi:hypothetical protein